MRKGGRRSLSQSQAIAAPHNGVIALMIDMVPEGRVRVA